jgi:hypothetical protein
MADRDDLEFTYSLIDRVFRLSLGELADFSGAKYDGDFSLSLEAAQRRKHEYVAEQIGIGPRRRVLDLAAAGPAPRTSCAGEEAPGSASPCPRGAGFLARCFPSARSRSSAAPSRTSAWYPAPAADSTPSKPSASGGSGSRRRKKTLLKLQLLPRWLTSADFRLAFTSGVRANSVCFERELLDHDRLVFEKEG